MTFWVPCFCPNILPSPQLHRPPLATSISGLQSLGCAVSHTRRISAQSALLVKLDYWMHYIYIYMHVCVWYTHIFVYYIYMYVNVYMYMQIRFMTISASHALEVQKYFLFNLSSFSSAPTTSQNHHQFCRNRMRLVSIATECSQNMTFSLLQQNLPGSQRSLWQSHW